MSSRLICSRSYFSGYTWRKCKISEIIPVSCQTCSMIASSCVASRSGPRLSNFHLLYCRHFLQPPRLHVFHPRVQRVYFCNQAYHSIITSKFTFNASTFAITGTSQYSPLFGRLSGGYDANASTFAITPSGGLCRRSKFRLRCNNRLRCACFGFLWRCPFQ